MAFDRAIFWVPSVRFYPEEFAVLLWDAPLLTVAAAAERIRAAVAGLALPHGGRSAGGVVTVSLGIASMVPADPHGARRLVELADARLYQAKRNGRNRVCNGRGIAADVEHDSW